MIEWLQKMENEKGKFQTFTNNLSWSFIGVRYNFKESGI